MLPVRSPAYRAHNCDDEAPGSRASVERLRDRDEGHLALLEEFEQRREVFDAAREAVQLGDDHGLDLAGIHQRQEPFDAPGRFMLLADSPPSTMTSSNSVPWTVAIALIRRAFFALRGVPGMGRT